jgi:hypothetical protein
VNDPDRRDPTGGFDDDAIFANIVAHLFDDAGQSEGTGLLRPENATTDDEATDEATDQSPGQPHKGPINQLPVLPGPGDPQSVPMPQVWRAHEVDDEDQEHFEPPPVTPLPVGDLQFWGIIAGMGGGPLLLLYLAFFNRDASGYWILIAIALSVGGFAMLVSRMPGHSQDNDDGARL